MLFSAKYVTHDGHYIHKTTIEPTSSFKCEIPREATLRITLTRISQLLEFMTDKFDEVILTNNKPKEEPPVDISFTQFNLMKGSMLKLCNKFTGLFRLPDIKHVFLINSTITPYIDNDASLSCLGNKGGELYVSEYCIKPMIDVCDSGLSAVNIGDGANIDTLNMKYNKLTTIDMSNVRLLSCNLSMNKLKSAIFGHVVSLEIYNNPLEELVISKPATCKYLDVMHTKLKKLPPCMVNLRYLNLTGTDIDICYHGDTKLKLCGMKLSKAYGTNIGDVELSFNKIDKLIFIRGCSINPKISDNTIRLMYCDSIIHCPDYPGLRENTAAYIIQKAWKKYKGERIVIDI